MKENYLGVRGESWMKKYFVIAAIFVSVLCVIASLYDYFRLEIIRITMDAGLPWWALNLLWGWR